MDSAPLLTTTSFSVASSPQAPCLHSAHDYQILCRLLATNPMTNTVFLFPCLLCLTGEKLGPSPLVLHLAVFHLLTDAPMPSLKDLERQ
ncbi:hypothetical protein HA466_0224530 [Hirschfeldia incana]|nr:hypothetical protein HA466_0224530 [Hirschfeldia incana]